jgi:hypothetical protein
VTPMTSLEPRRPDLPVAPSWTPRGASAMRSSASA